MSAPWLHAQQPPAPRRRRRVWPWFAAAAAVLVIVIAATTSRGTPAPTSTTPTTTPGATVTAAPPAPTAPAIPAAAEPAAPSPATFSDGTHEVGPDIPAGKYKTTGPEPTAFGGGNCYWARLKNTDGGFDAIITNGNTAGPATITVKASDVAVEASGSCVWTKQ